MIHYTPVHFSINFTEASLSTKLLFFPAIFVTSFFVLWIRLCVPCARGSVSVWFCLCVMFINYLLLFHYVSDCWSTQIVNTWERNIIGLHTIVLRTFPINLVCNSYSMVYYWYGTMSSQWFDKKFNHIPLYTILNVSPETDMKFWFEKSNSNIRS